MKQVNDFYAHNPQYNPAIYRRKTIPDASSLFNNNPNIQVVDGVDVTKDEGIGCLVEALEKAGNPTVDILINNAGVMLRSRNALEIEVLRESMEVNAYGAIRVTTALLRQRLLASPGAKIALITSKMGSMADNTSGGAYGYRMSKAALNAAGVSLAHDLKGDGMAVAILHPGERETHLRCMLPRSTSRQIYTKGSVRFLLVVSLSTMCRADPIRHGGIDFHTLKLTT